MKSTPMMAIGEVAARFGLAPHVLRHWEAMGLLSPRASRVTAAATAATTSTGSR
ncbi:MerR family DNA-binding transcriptional regulator [Nonomuraea sp. N2-4H]